MEEIKLTSGITIDKNTFLFNMKRIINQVYKLLPMRQEKQDWIKPLETIIVELSGMKDLIGSSEILFFTILCKLRGLLNLILEDDMSLYRRVIFECLGLLSELEKNVLEQY